VAQLTRSWFGLVLAGTLSLDTFAAESLPPLVPNTSLAPKLFVRFSSGLISNVGTTKGSGFSYGGGNIGFVYFINGYIALGLGYKAESNFTSVPLQGIDIFERIYFLGGGTVASAVDSAGARSESHKTWNPYLGLEYSNRSFYVEGDPTATTAEGRAVSGKLSALNLSAGLDYRLSRHWEFTTELNSTLLAFAGSDPRVKIRWIFLSLGGNYVF